MEPFPISEPEISVVIGSPAEVQVEIRGFLPDRCTRVDYVEQSRDGDNVIVINAQQVVFTGKKRNDKVYYWHTGHPGGIKERSADKILDGRYPERVLQKAVERMVPRGPLGRRQMKNLRIYGGAEHPHEAQQPVKLDVGALNSKNIGRTK